MRPLKPADAIRAIQITTRHPMSHGAPLHIGAPESIGINPSRTIAALAERNVGILIEELGRA